MVLLYKKEVIVKHFRFELGEEREEDEAYLLEGGGERSSVLLIVL